MSDNVLMNPFPGLRAFEEEEDILFFGREKQIDELLRKLRTSRFLAIIGSSGSGKSSLVKSGLLPSLHSGLMSGVGSQWRIALFRPGNDPIGNLTNAISKDGVLRDNQTEEELDIHNSINEAILRRSNLGLIEAYKQSGLDKRNNLLILVDQFEELFRFTKYEKDVRDGKRDSITFINLLLKAAEQKEYPIYVVFTMRSDFLGECTEFRGLPEAINEGQYLVPRMTREERREAITGPIAVGASTITPALLNRLLNDVGDNPDQLPILQHALMRTWDSWKKKEQPGQSLDIEDYEHIGTITEALSQHAEEAYSELSTEKEQQICEKIFKELTDKSGLSSGVRRPRLLSELSAAAGVSNEDVIKIIEIFRKPGRGFLMPAYPVPITPDSIIDISHESLMRVWKRLITWLEDEEESAQVYLHLCDAVNLYETGKGGVWRDPELQIALKWKAEQNTNAAWASRYNPYYDKVIFFLEHSKQQRDLEIKHKEELQKQRLRITRRISIIVSIIALIAMLTAIVAFQLRSEAKKAQSTAESAKLTALAEKRKAENNRKAAVIAEGIAVVAKDSAEKSKQVAIQQQQIAIKQEGIAKQESHNAKIAEGEAKESEQAALASKNAAIESEKQAEKSRQEAEISKLKAITEKEKAERLHMLAESKNDAHKVNLYINNKEYQQGLDLALNAYKNNLDNGGNFQDNDIYNALLLSWENTIGTERSKIFNAPVRSLSGLPHSNVIFSGDETGKIVTCQYNNGVLKEKSVINAGNGLRALAVAPGGDYLLAVLFNQAVLFKINDDKSLTRYASVLLNGIGKHGVFMNSKYFLIQNANGVTKYEIKGPVQAVDSIKLDNCSAITVSSKGSIFISAGKNIFQYRGWDGTAISPEKTYKVQSNVTSIGVDGSGKYLAAGTYDGGIWLKVLSSSNDAVTYPLHRSAVNDIKFSIVAPGKLQLASASSDKSIKLTEVNDANSLNADNVITLSEHTNWVYTIFYTPDGKYLFSGSEDRFVKGWPTTMEELYNNLTKK